MTVGKPELIPFAPWTPDQPVYGNPGAAQALNVIRIATGYIPSPGLAPFLGDPIPGDPVWLNFNKDFDGNFVSFAGTRTHLYKIENDGTLTDFTNPGFVGPLADTDRWNSTTFGELTIVTALGSPIQRWSQGDATFLDLGDDVPEAKYVATGKNFIMAANLVDGLDLNQPRRLRWCGFEAPFDWVASAATQADFQDVFNIGDLQGITGGEYFTVLGETGLARVTYVGPPLIFQVDELIEEHGCDLPGSVTKVSDLTYYHSSDGWRVFDGVRSMPIGAGKIDRTFAADIDTSFKHNMYVGHFDDLNVIFWSYPGQNSGGVNNRTIYYNTVLREWSTSNFGADVIGRLAGSGFTIDQLDANWPSIDDMPYSLDDPFWTGQRDQVGGIKANEFVSYGGEAPPGILETGERQPFAPSRTYIESIQLIAEDPDTAEVKTDDTTIAIGSRDVIGGPVVWSQEHSRTSEGFFWPDEEGRYQRLRVTLAHPWYSAQGLLVTERPGSIT